MLYDIPERWQRRLDWHGQICGDPFSFCIIYHHSFTGEYAAKNLSSFRGLDMTVHDGAFCEDFSSFFVYCFATFFCYFVIFLPGRDGQRLLRVKQAGSNRGLHLILNVRQEEYYGTTSYVAGLKVLIHDQQTLPLVSQLGFAVSPGTSTFAALKKLRVIDYIV